MERPIKIPDEKTAEVTTSIQANEGVYSKDDVHGSETNKEIKFASDTASVRYFTSYVKNWEANWLKDDQGP